MAPVVACLGSGAVEGAGGAARAEFMLPLAGITEVTCQRGALEVRMRLEPRAAFL